MSQIPVSALKELQAAVLDGRLAAAVRRRQHGAALDTATAALDRHAASINRIEQLAQVTPVVVGHLDPHALTDLRHRLVDLVQEGRSFQTTANTGDRASGISTDTLEAAHRQLGVVDRLVSEVDTLLERGWAIRIDVEFATLGQLGEALEVMNAEPQLGARMREIAARGLKLRAAFPPSEETIAALAEYAESRDSALAELSKSGSGIGPFLLSVAKGAATLADLDDDTLTWLRSQGALNMLSVRLSRL